MATSYSSPLRLAIQATGDNANTWGDILNNNTIEMLEQSIAEVSTIDLTVGTGNYTLTTANGSPDEARRAILKFIGTPTVSRTAIIPSLPKLYAVHNKFSANFTVTISTGSGSTVTLAQNKTGFVYCDGTEVFLVGPTDALLASNNLSDLANAATARTNLGLGALAVLSAITSANITDGTITAADLSTAVVNSIAPSQTGESGSFLSSNGTNLIFKKVLRHALVYQGSAGTVLNNGVGVYTTLSFDTEATDTPTWHSTSVNPERLTFDVAGVYIVFGQVTIPNNNNGPYGVKIRKNGSVDLSLHTLTNGPSYAPSLPTFALAVIASPGDYVELLANNGPSPNVTSTIGLGNTFFGAVQIG